MQPLEKSGTFEQTSPFQGLHQALITLLEEYGTLISLGEDIEKDADIAPYRFFRRSKRTYIFPKQDVTTETSRKDYASKETPYQITFTDVLWKFNPQLVQGKITIHYEDADNVPSLAIKDDLASSALHGQLEQKILQLFQ